MGVDAEIYLEVQSEKNKYTDDERRIKSFEMGSRFGSDYFMSLDGEYFFEDVTNEMDRHAVEALPKAVQLIIIRQMMRYYGNHYERGYVPFLYTLLKYLHETEGHRANVLYNADANDLSESEYAVNALPRMWSHFVDVGHRPYRREGYGIMDKESTLQCPHCKVPFMHTGGGGGKDFLVCDGCGTSAIFRSRDAYMRYLTRREDFFKVSQEMDN